MRVVHLCPALFGPNGVTGGAERYAFELARHMAREVPTTLLVFGDDSRVDESEGLHIRVLGRPWLVRGQRANPITFGLFAALRDADVVHCHQTHVLASSLTALWRRLAGGRVFATDLGGGGWDLSAYFNTDRWYDGHLHLSDYSRAGYGHCGPFAHVIGAGVDTEKFSPDGATLRSGVLYAGRILPHKGLDVLIKAMPPGVPLTIAGREADARYLDDLRRLAAGKEVSIRRDWDDDQLVAAYRRARCVVLPSVSRTMYGGVAASSELLGQTLLEAMACGAPVVGSNLGGVNEVIDDGRTGFLVPPGEIGALAERINWIHAHPCEAAEMGAAGRRRMLDHFTWPRVVRRCLEIYAA